MISISETFHEELEKIQLAIISVIAGIVLVRCLIILSNAKNNEQPLNATLEQCKKVIVGGVIAAFLPDYISILTSGVFTKTYPYREHDFSLFPFIEGTILLAKTTSNLFVLLSATMTVYHVIKNGLAWQTAAVEQKPIYKEQIKKVFLIGLLTISGSGILSAIFGYFDIPT